MRRDRPHLFVWVPFTSFGGIYKPKFVAVEHLKSSYFTFSYVELRRVTDEEDEEAPGNKTELCT